MTNDTNSPRSFAAVFDKVLEICEVTDGAIVDALAYLDGIDSSMRDARLARLRLKTALGLVRQLDVASAAAVAELRSLGDRLNEFENPDDIPF